MIEEAVHPAALMDMVAENRGKRRRRTKHICTQQQMWKKKKKDVVYFQNKNLLYL